MKNKLGFGTIYLLIGVLLVFGPMYLFQGCTFNPEKPMRCWWSTKAVLGIGLVFLAIGICYMIIKSMEVRIGISLISIFVGTLAILIPSFLIGGCKKQTMSCLTTEFPMIYLISVIAIIASFINIIYLNNAVKRNK